MTRYIRIDTQRFMVSLWEQYYLIIREFVLNMCTFYNKYDGCSSSHRTINSCQRLSLTPLCFLWQRDQEELLSEMIEARVEAVLIKVAGIGLKPVHLGKTLEEMQPTLLHLV